jgi:peptidoglycan-associated lipoprotein
MSKRVAVSFVLIGLVAFLFMGCQRKTIIEGGAEEAKQTEVMAGEGEISDQEQPALDREQIEASLETKEYPGIEGEVFESSMLQDIHFGFDRYDLTARSREILARNAEFILQFPEAKIQVEGHCDERGTSEYNLALGERRGLSTKRYLLSLGVPTHRLSTISYGEELPIDPRHNEEAWGKNRRAHFVILSK